MSRHRSGLAVHRRAYMWDCEKPIITLGVVSGVGSSYTSNLTQIALPGSIFEAGSSSIPNTLDDGRVPIPMSSMEFNFFGTNYSNSLYWSSNNALLFGTQSTPQLDIDITRNAIPSILLGNYDRLLKTFYYSNSSNSNYSITTLLITFYNYYTDSVSASTYQYKIRLIKENTGNKNQFVEVYVISSPPSPGYSSAAISYPSGTDASGNPMDSNGNTMDSTKNSPYNITNGTVFLNPCGTTFSTVSPSTNTSFVFSSDYTGSNWTFTNNAHVNV